MGQIVHLKTDWMKVKTTVDVELLYQTHCKERLVAPAVRSGPSSVSSFKVYHGCRELPHSKRALPSMVHIQLLIEAGAQRPEHFSPRWVKSDKPYVYRDFLWGGLRHCRDFSAVWLSSLPYPAFFSFPPTVADSNKYSAQQTQHLLLENLTYDKDSIICCL